MGFEWTDERSGFSYYLAKIELTEDPREIFNGAELYPGMPAEVMIVTGSGTALDEGELRGGAPGECVSPQVLGGAALSEETR